MKPRGRGIPGLPSLDIPKAVAATLDEALTGIRERHATLAKLTKFSPSSAYWRRLHMDIGVLLEVYDRQCLLLNAVSPATVKGAAEHVKNKARADRAEAVLRELRTWLEAQLAEEIVAQNQAIKANDFTVQRVRRGRANLIEDALAELDELEREVGRG